MSRSKDYKANNKNQDIIDKFIFEYKASKPDASKHTIRAYDQTLRKLSTFLENNTKHKSLKKTTKLELQKFFNNKKYVPNGSHNQTGTLLLKFYKFIYGKDKHSRPPNMLWFEQSSKRTKKRLRDPHRIKNLLLSPEEYKTIINYSNDYYGRDKAIFETYYLSGFRPEELQSMTINDVNIDKNTNIVSVSCPKSKTNPRTIKLTESADLLKRYLGNHPDKNNKTSPLWFRLIHSKNLKKLSINSIQTSFRQIRDNTNIKNTLVIKSFRKTRFTIMSNLRGKDNQIIYNNSDLAKYFGWEYNTIDARRREYDLSNDEHMEKIILSKPIIPKDYDTIAREKKIIEDKYQKEINKLKNKIIDLEEGYEEFTDFIKLLKDKSKTNSVLKWLEDVDL